MKVQFWGKGRSFWTKYSTVLNVYVQRWPHTATDQTILPGTKQSRGYFSTWQSDCRSQIKHFHLYTPKWYSQTHCQMQRTVQSCWDVPKESVSIWKVISIFISYVFSKLFRLGYILTVGIALTNEWGGFPGLINRPNSWKSICMMISKDRTHCIRHQVTGIIIVVSYRGYIIFQNSCF